MEGERENGARGRKGEKEKTNGDQLAGLYPINFSDVSTGDTSEISNIFSLLN